MDAQSARLTYLLRPFIQLFVIMVVSSIVARFVAARMRRRIRSALDKNVSDIELTSIKTWIAVEDNEERTEEKPPPP